MTYCLIPKYVTLLTICLIVITLTRCAATLPLTEAEIEQEQKNLDSLFLFIRQNIKLANAESVYKNLSSLSQEWFVNMRIAAQSEPVNFLITRPFFEILAILSLRVDQRHHPNLSDDPVSILQRTIINVSAIRKNFIKHPLGTFTVSSYRAEIGLKKTPQVPVFFFVKEHGLWKMDLIKTLPLILLGAEGIARNFKNEIIEQAIYIIETIGGTTVLPEDLRP